MVFRTRQIYAGQAPDASRRARELPIYKTTSLVFPSAECSKLLALADLAPIYIRIGNPAQEGLERRITSLEGWRGSPAV